LQLSQKKIKKICVTQKLRLGLRNLKVTCYVKEYSSHIIFSEQSRSSLGISYQFRINGIMADEK
jgi:hypothetical protein